MTIKKTNETTQFWQRKKERKLKKSFYTKIRTKTITESYIYQFVFTNMNKKNVTKYQTHTN